MTSAMELDGKGLEALARAYDREDAAQRGEPDPWTLDGQDDAPLWHEERIACARVAADAFLTTSGLTDRLKELERERDDAFDDAKHAEESFLASEKIGMQLRAERDAMAADNAVLRKLERSNLSTMEEARRRLIEYGKGTAELTAAIEETRGAALSNQPTATLKVEGTWGKCATEGCEAPAAMYFQRGGVGSYYCASCYLKVQAIPYATASQPAEGQGERGEAWSINVNESDGRTYLWLTRNDGVSAALSCRTNTDNGETIVSQVAKQFAADYATPPAPKPLEGAVKIGDIIHQIALWSDDEGLELSMGQGEDLARRIRSALPAPAGDGWRLVPVEPTEHMLREMAAASRDFLKMVYRAMLAAAPVQEDGR